MSVTLVFLAVLMGAVVWWLLKQTFNVRPWVSDQLTSSVRDEGIRSVLTATPLPSIKLGLGVFLAVATSLFALFISAYSIRMEYEDWRPLPEPALLWINSGILLGSSVFLQMAWNAVRREDAAGVRRGILLGGALAVAFIIGQLMVWSQLSGSGYLLTSNPANAFFYLLTAVHALHLVGGLFALGRSVKRVWGGEEDRESIETGVELCAVYWHYLLVIWAVLFGLLLTT